MATTKDGPRPMFSIYDYMSIRGGDSKQGLSYLPTLGTSKPSPGLRALPMTWAASEDPRHQDKTASPGLITPPMGRFCRFCRPEQPLGALNCRQIGTRPSTIEKRGLDSVDQCGVQKINHTSDNSVVLQNWPIDQSDSSIILCWIIDCEFNDISSDLQASPLWYLTLANTKI